MTKKIIVSAAGFAAIAAGAFLGVGTASAAPAQCTMPIGNGQFAPCPPHPNNDGAEPGDDVAGLVGTPMTTTNGNGTGAATGQIISPNEN